MKDNPHPAAVLDPRVAFALVVYLSTFAIFFRDALRLLPVFVLALCCSLAMRVELNSLFYKLRRLWYAIIVVAFMQGIFNPSGAVWLQIGRFTLLTGGGVDTALTVLMRLAILLIGGSILSRYQTRVLIQAIIQLHIPYEFAYMVSVGLRFIPLSAQAFRDSLTAIQLRGINFNTLKFSRRIQVYATLLMPTVAAGLNSAHELAVAMELRGFRAFDKRTSYFCLKMRPFDFWVLAGVALLAALSVLYQLFIHLPSLSSVYWRIL